MTSINSLIAVLSYAIAICGIIPLFPWLELFPRVLLVIGLIAGIWQDRRGGWPFKNWMFNTAIVPVFVWYVLQFSRSNPVQPVVSVLSVMLAVRLAGPKNSRHYLQSAALSLFCLSSSSLFDLRPQFMAYLALMIFMVAVLLVLLTFYKQDNQMDLTSGDLHKVLMAGILMPLVALPLLVMFFPLLPRTQLPLWNFRAAAPSRPSGFSEVVEPGSSRSVSESRQLVFRAEMPRQPQQKLYWRGTVFNRPEGRGWVRVGVPAEEIQYAGQLISQILYPEPGANRILFALDAPASISQPRTLRSSDGTFEWLGPLGRRLTYTAESQVEGILPVQGTINRAFYLKVPDSVSPRIRELAAEIRRQAGNDTERLEKVESYFRQGGFRYSRQGLPTGDHALEQFLFETRQGHCEFFASSFALLLRAAGIPARVIGGYLGGEYNELGGYYLISEDMAHVWVEAFVAGQGWLRIDPSGFAQNAEAVWGGAPKRSLSLRMRLMLDSMDHIWNRTVITYDFERQADVVRQVGGQLKEVSTAGLLKNVKPFIVLLVSIPAFWVLFRFRRIFYSSREERLVRRFCRRVERDCGLLIQRGGMGLFEIAAISGNSKVREFVDLYAGTVYRDRKLTDEEYGRLNRMLNNGFRNSPS